MGRLIDADKLKAQVEAHEIKYKFTPTDYQYGHNVGIDKAVADIDDAEAVEAIPVDWLLRKAEWCDKNNCIFVSGAIRSAVDAWKEEQEGD